MMSRRMIPVVLALLLYTNQVFADAPRPAADSSGPACSTMRSYRHLLADRQAMAEVVQAVATGLSALCLDKPEDQQIAIIGQFIENVRFLKDQSGYFYVYNHDGVCIAHAIQKDLVGRDLSDYRDSNGKYVIRELSRTARQGGGLVDFRWQKPDGTPDNAKLGYVAPISNTDFFIGSGISLPDNHWIVSFAYAKPPFVFAPPPFSCADYDVYGEPGSVELTLFREALAAAGHTFTPVYHSYDELEAGLKNGTIEVAATVRNTLPHVHYSQEFVAFQNVAVTRKSRDISISKLADLQGKSIVTWEGAAKDLGPDFQNAVKDNEAYHEMGNQAEQGAFFFGGKAEVIVIDRTIFDWWLTAFADTHDTSGAFVFHDLFPERTVFYAGFQSEELRDIFDKGLSIIKENGTYSDIVSF